MKKIPDALKLEIEDASNAGLLKGLPPAVIEKDIHITDVLFILSGIQQHLPVFHVDNRQRKTDSAIKLSTSLVFSGGTCLSKAHGIIERMSEDIDIKVMLDDVPHGYVAPKRIASSNHARLKRLHNELLQKLEGAGFRVTNVPDVDNPDIKDNRRYFHVTLAYETVFATPASLRPELKLELIHRDTMLPSSSRSVGYLLAQCAPGTSLEKQAELQCFAVEETLAEKVLSLLRRCAWYWAGHQRGEFDQALIRHIYDVWRIRAAVPGSLAKALAIFPSIVAKDVEEFGNQNPDFVKNPKVELEKALQRAKTDTGLIANFNEKLVPLLFADNAPSYEAAFAIFEDTARLLLASLPDTADILKHP